jgi:ParB family transcriptional regulator, chromosome partitioning protein
MNKTSAVPFERIELTLGNCREKLKNIQALAADIKERGLLQPLVVLHRHYGGGRAYELEDGTRVYDRYQLVAGHRRHAALALIREEDPDAFAKVPVTLFAGTETDALMAQIAENVAREELTPIELASAIHRLRAKDVPVETIASRLARSREWVRQLLKLREACAEEVQAAVSAGELPVTTALELAALEPAKQLEALADHRRAGSATEKRAVRASVARAAGKASRPSVADIRAKIEWLDGESKSKHAPAVRKALAWVLGDAEWS